MNYMYVYIYIRIYGTLYVFIDHMYLQIHITCVDTDKHPFLVTRTATDECPVSGLWPKHIGMVGEKSYGSSLALSHGSASDHTLHGDPGHGDIHRENHLQMVVVYYISIVDDFPSGWIYLVYIYYINGVSICI